MANNSRIAKNTVFLYFRMFFTMLVALFTVRIVMKTLGVEDYGLYNVVGGVVLSMTFLSRVLAVASQRFFSLSIGKNDFEGLKHIFSSILFVYIVLSVIIVILAETLGLWFVMNRLTIPSERLTAAIYTYHFALLSFIVTIITSPHQALIIAHEKMDIYAYASIIEVILKLVIVYLLYISPIDKLVSYGFLMFISTLLSYGVYFIYCKKKYSEEVTKPRWDPDTTKSVFSYSGWTLFGSLSGVCANQGISIVLNVFYGPIANAAYAIGLQLSSQVNAFANNFLVAVRPPLIKSYASSDFDYMDKLFYMTSKVSFVLMYIVLLPLYIEIEAILQIWLGSVGVYMVSFTRLMLIYSLILIFGNPITTIVQAAGNVKQYHLLVDGFTLLCLPIAYVSYKLGAQVESSLIILCVVFFIAHAIRLIILKKTVVFSIKRYITRFIIPTGLTIIVSYAFSMVLQKVLPSSLIGVLIVCVFSAIIAFVVSALLLFGKDERNMVMRLIKERKK